MFLRSVKGFTLVEIVTVILIISLLGLIVLKFSSNINASAMPNLTNRLMLQMEGRKLADNLLENIRKSGEIIRPGVGESTPFLLLKDAENRITYYYLNHDSENSKIFDKRLFELHTFLYAYDKEKSRQKKLGSCIESICFTGVSPSCIQINIRIANDKNRFQFISQAGLMSIGDSDV